jgi:hypothetical protein
MRHHLAEWLGAFPDIRFTIERMLAEGDRVMTQCVARGKHLESWLGIPATGKIITIQMFVVHRIADGLIAEDWVLVDSLGVFQQLGLVPPTEQVLAQATDDRRPTTEDQRVAHYRSLVVGRRPRSKALPQRTQSLEFPL